MSQQPNRVLPIAQQHARLERERRDRAREYLTEVLANGPGQASMLRLGGYVRGIPIRSIHAARIELGVEEYYDQYGVIMWRLKG